MADDNVIKADFSKLPKESEMIREIIDHHSFEGKALGELELEDLLRATELLLIYIPFLELTLKKHDVKRLETIPEQ